ncbi:MAG: Ferrous iron transport protein B [Deltaproteobacteria bacterium ADurb.BinA179]|jgi:ferrous iron transport protein B|nr:MAG: Ferrous iron transport protein B [Deltaproteobacteria bacterium ADurb.BinA179]HOD69447.1 ferrous iron transport protein B [Deltaproteobacteria bacterium]HOE71306.1 ferrous iron transport protein B [Deltaproteobacteria bacterium]HON60375.1 ferrous iron transport protein B [Deltaproteobacteria bacterium]HOS26160.1 ferrous iron transport protein B [Deltaproteobacteria bacterium]
MWKSGTTSDKSELVIALAGQPNCGKSTIFNAVAGFKVNTGNFSGTTVSFTETDVYIGGRTIRLIDLPGTYSLTAHDAAERVARDYLLSGRVDVIINVIDTSLLARSLELTLQLIEMDVPMVVALNMFDEAQKKGMEIDIPKLKSLTGVEACPLVAVQGSGVHELFETAIRVAQEGFKRVAPVYDRDVEECIAAILARYPSALRERLAVDERFVVIQLLEMDEEFETITRETDSDFMEYVHECRRSLAQIHDWPESGVFASHRHALVLDLFEEVAVVKSRAAVSPGEAIDRFIINPVGGLAATVGVFFSMFAVSFWIGNLIAGLVEGPLDSFGIYLNGHVSGSAGILVSGIYDGFTAGVGIVLPYLIPLLVVLSLLEDTGLLPRIAFMVDGLLHRFGLHGKSVVPIIMGYGCNVPAIMAARNLEYERDRVVTMLMVPFIACSARTVIILALAGKYLGAGYTTLIYLGNIAIALGISSALSRFSSDLSPGIIMDVPPLRRPYLHIVSRKVWVRILEFLLFAWPIIAVSSIALAVFSFIGIDGAINRLFSPVTEIILRLPSELGITLFLGIFRKELTLIMLNSALDTADVSLVLSSEQILVLVVFTVLYIPCIATITTLWKEGGAKVALLSIVLNTSVALAVAGAVAWLV